MNLANVARQIAVVRRCAVLARRYFMAHSRRRAITCRRVVWAGRWLLWLKPRIYRWLFIGVINCLRHVLADPRDPLYDQYLRLRQIDRCIDKYFLSVLSFENTYYKLGQTLQAKT